MFFWVCFSTVTGDLSVNLSFRFSTQESSKVSRRCCYPRVPLRCYGIVWESVIEKNLTDMENQQTIPRAGQTDVGAAGEQSARDNRPGRRNNVGVEPPPTRLFQSPLYLKKLSAEGRFSHLTGKAICPIPAEPIHLQYNRDGEGCKKTMSVNHC